KLNSCLFECLNFELAKSLFKLNYVPEKKYGCVFILYFYDKLSMKVSRILKEQVLYPHILIYKDAFLFPINIYYYYVLKECLWSLVQNFSLFTTPICHLRKNKIFSY